jgi:hypothetical protein
MNMVGYLLTGTCNDSPDLFINPKIQIMSKAMITPRG